MKFLDRKTFDSLCRRVEVACRERGVRGIFVAADAWPESTRVCQVLTRRILTGDYVGLPEALRTVGMLIEGAGLPVYGRYSENNYFCYVFVGTIPGTAHEILDEAAAFHRSIQ